jgi:hypothetical protein
MIIVGEPEEERQGDNSPVCPEANQYVVEYILWVDFGRMSR